MNEKTILNYNPEDLITETAFLSLYHRRLFFSMQGARIQKLLRESVKTVAVLPFEHFLLHIWQKNLPGKAWIERAGLPRRSMEKKYKDILSLEIEPGLMNNLASFKNKRQRRRMYNRFILDGQWDLHTREFNKTFRYLFLSDIWEHRCDLTQSRRYAELMKRCEQGKPYRSYHKGVYLNTGEKIHTFLKIYLTFMEQIQQHGYDPALTNDPLGIALGRNGNIIKINKGLHRLAMAQIVGLEKIPVKIRAVHRLWWEKQISNSDSGKANDLYNLISHISRD